MRQETVNAMIDNIFSYMVALRKQLRENRSLPNTLKRKERTVPVTAIFGDFLFWDAAYSPTPMVLFEFK